LTATPRKTGEAGLVAEGLFGPIIETISVNEAIEKNFLSKPKIHILRVEKNYKIAELRRYNEVYDKAIVENIPKNRLILQTAKKHLDFNHSILILISKLRQGELLMNLAQEMNIKATFVQGSTDAETRTKIKDALNSKEEKLVIASVIFTEGIDLPELNVLINAAGGKSEIRTLQSIGRGLRKTKNKDEVIIYDVFDPSSKFLVEHFGFRFCTYCDAGWID
jgi:superfamily II DNA or RNA helicase